MGICIRHWLELVMVVWMPIDYLIDGEDHYSAKVDVVYCHRSYTPE